MKRISTIIKAAFLLMLLETFSPMMAQVINNNGGFENWATETTTTPDNWLGSKSNVSTNNYAQVTNPVHSGTYACRLINVSANHKRFTTEEIDLTGNHSYTISFYASGIGQIRTALAYTDGTTYTYGNYNEYVIVNNLTGFTYIEQTVTAPNTATAGEFILSFRNTDSTAGHLVIDDVEITDNGEVQGNNFANIAAFKSATVQGPSTITGDVIYVFRSGRYMYIKDNTAGLLVYDNNTPIITTTYNEGDIISGGIIGTQLTYLSQLEFIPTANTATATSNSGTVTPLVVTIADLISNYAAYDAQLITLSNVTLTNDLSFTTDSTGNNFAIEQNGSSVFIRNNFKTLDTTMTANTVTDITGFVAIHGTTIQIYPRSNADLVPQSQVVTPILSVLSPTSNATFTTLDTIHVNVDVQNFVLGTDGYLKVESALLPSFGLTNPFYCTDTELAVLEAQNIQLPAGQHNVIFSLVDMSLTALSTPVIQNVTFSVVAPVVETPTIQVSGDQNNNGAYWFSADVTLSCATADATIYYTTDGTEPNDNSTTYDNPFTVTNTETVKAIAIKNLYTNSAVATQLITIEIPAVATPTFDPNGGIFTTSVDVTINSDTNTTVRYTTDGTEPTSTSTPYNGAISLTTTTTLKAKTFRTNWTPSATATAEFTIVNEPTLAVNPTVLNFTTENLSQDITISAAFISNPITLTCNDTHFTLSQSSLSTPNGNNTITVTFDGTEPANDIIYITADTLTVQVNLSATAQLPAPVITPATGTSDTLILVTMSCTTAGADIHYTTDGTEPTIASATYNTPIELNIPGTYTVKAIAMMSTWENSDVAEAIYTISAPEPQINDSLVFYTGFEEAEGFTATSTYNIATETVSGPESNSWSTVYGTPSATSPLQGAQSMQMRWYTSAATTIGYTKTNFDIAHATKVKFSAMNSNGMKLSVAHSTDGGNTYSTPVIFDLTSSTEEYTYMVSETGQYDFVRFLFNVVLPETAPTSTSRVYLDSVRFYGIPGMATTTVSAPIITPNGGNFVDTVHVNISCSTNGAQIYYTVDGTTPDDNATPYNGPFDVTSTTTVKAIAYAFGYNPSNVVTATYNFPIEVANIAAFKAANTATNNTVYKITGDVTFVYSHDANFYIQDTTGSLLIYNNQNVISNSYTEGDIISGGIYGTYTLYNGLVEMIPTHNIAASTTNSGTISPLSLDIEAIEAQYAQYESRLVTLHNVTFTAGGTFTTTSATNMDIEQNGETMQVRNTFKTLDMTIPAGYVADVTGFVSIYTNNSTGVTTYQIAPRDNNDIVGTTIEMDTVATPVITVEPLTNAMYNATIECETDGAVIYYTVNGTELNENIIEYTGSFVVDGGRTIKAFAVKEGMVNSAFAIYAYTGINNVDITVSIYPNPTADRILVNASNEEIESICIFDIYGKMLANTAVHSTTADIDLSSYSTGNYILRIVSANGTFTQKVIKK